MSSFVHKQAQDATAAALRCDCVIYIIYQLLLSLPGHVRVPHRRHALSPSPHRLHPARCSAGEEGGPTWLLSNV